MPAQAKPLLQFCIKTLNVFIKKSWPCFLSALATLYISLHFISVYADGLSADGLEGKPVSPDEAVTDFPPKRPAGGGSNNGLSAPSPESPLERVPPFFNRPGILPDFNGKLESLGRVYRPAERPWQRQQGIANRDDSLPPEAATLNLKTIGPAKQIELLGSGFYYPADFGSRYMRAKSNWREAHDGEPIALDTLHMLALQALDPKPDTLKLLETWRIQGGPAPWLFYPVVLLHNLSLSEAVLNVRLKMKLEFQFGQYFVDPNTLLVDYEHLKQSAQWEPVLEKERWLHSLAPQEDAQVVLNPVDLLLAMENRKNQWPYAIRLTVTLLPAGQVIQSSTLTLTPDHFALPLTFY
jgi:hypothetical protein